MGPDASAGGPGPADTASGAGPSRDAHQCSARNAKDHARGRSVRRGFDWLPLTDEIGERAIEVQGLLAQSGDRLRASLADLLIAATAERHGVVVLRHDADYDGIAKVTGQPVEWVVEQGPVP
ncbi:PIN domain-containing protein [Streptomyces sp. NPDC058892]|uniref:PIN domain-containing protein n=1 Tax=unclassified Streptomyces TaxID=2593676 RepID=UPI0036C3B4DD